MNEGLGRSVGPGVRGTVFLAAALLALAALAAFVLLRPDLPAQIDRAQFEQLVASGQVARLDQVGAVTTVTTSAGNRLRVDGISQRDMASLIRDHPATEISATSGADVELILQAVIPALIPPALAVALLAGFIVHRRRATPSGHAI